MQMERPYATFYLLAMAMFALSVTFCEILTVEMYMSGSRSNAKMPVERSHATFYVFTIAIVLSVNVCEIITFELPEVRDVDDLYENWLTNGPCDRR